MTYTELTKKAIIIALSAHKEQVDKAGLPYIFHPLHLDEQMNDESSVCAALLHDVVVTYCKSSKAGGLAPQF